MFNELDISLIWPAFLAGIIVLSTHVPLGVEVLKRGIIFIDLAIAQMAGLGVIFAHLLGWGEDVWLVQLSALLAALLAALLLRLSEKCWPEIQEALIGVSFVLAATLGVIMLAGNPHGGEALADILVGQILWIDIEQLIPVLAVYALILLIWFKFKEVRKGVVFYLLFALAITQSVQLVGVYLVFASLIIPALINKSSSASSLLSGYSVGLLGYGVGLVVAHIQDWPAGAVIVWTMAVFALLWVAILKGTAKN